MRPNFEEGGTAATGRKHEFIRSESENWRIFREEQNGEDEDGGWRLAGSRRDGERWRPHSPGERRSGEKCSHGYRERAAGDSRHRESRGKGGGREFGTEKGKVHVLLVIKCSFGMLGALGHKMTGIILYAFCFLFNVFNTLPYLMEQYFFRCIFVCVVLQVCM